MRRAFAVSVFLLVGCGSTTSTPTGPTIEDGCLAYSQNFCDKANACASFFIQVTWGDAALCKTRLNDACLRSAKAPNTGVTAASFDKCVKAIPAITCDDFFNGVPIADCQVTGTQDDGKTCGDGAQCKSGFCAWGGSTCGTCSPKVTEGGACVSSSCPDGLDCVSGKCQKPVAAGGACSVDKPCGSNLSCVTGSCLKTIDVEGAACDDKEATAPKCDFTKSLACIANKCMKFRIVTTGGECGIRADLTKSPPLISDLMVCDKGGYCKGVDTAKGVLLGTCAPVAGDGQPCNPKASTFGEGPGCINPATCVPTGAGTEGVCKIIDPGTCR